MRKIKFRWTDDSKIDRFSSRMRLSFDFSGMVFINGKYAGYKTMDDQHLIFNFSDKAVTSWKKDCKTKTWNDLTFPDLPSGCLIVVLKLFLWSGILIVWQFMIRVIKNWFTESRWHHEKETYSGDYLYPAADQAACQSCCVRYNFPAVCWFFSKI